MRFRFLSHFLFLGFLALQVATAGAADGWLPLKRSDIIELLAAEKHEETVKIDAWEELQRIVDASYFNRGPRSYPNKVHYWTARASDLSNIHPSIGLLAPDENVSFAVNPAIPLAIVMAGKDEAIHSLRAMVPIVNYSETEAEQIFGVLSTLFRRIYPAWSDAGEWPRTSLLQSWNAHPFVDGNYSKNPNDLIIRKQFDGITSATFGVPPDIVVYTVTARDQCVPRVDQDNPLRSDDPFQRLIC